MSTLKLQRDVNAMPHGATCKRLVEVVSQGVVIVRRVKEVLRQADAMMKAVT